MFESAAVRDWLLLQALPKCVSGHASVTRIYRNTSCSLRLCCMVVQIEARLAKDSGDMWMAAASQDAQVELQNADKAPLQGKDGDEAEGGAEEREQQQQHDHTEL